MAHNCKVEIKLQRVDRIYRENEIVKGTVIVSLDNKQRTLSHNGIRLKVNGSTKLQLSARSVGLFEAFYASVKPMELLSIDLVINTGDKIMSGSKAEYPFEFKLENKNGELFETYHGVYVYTTYTIGCEISRGYLASSIVKEIEFVLEVPTNKTYTANAGSFCITPTSLENTVDVKLPDFTIAGKLHCTNCHITKPLTGEIVVEESAGEVKSIDVQLVRVETVAYTEGAVREATDVQTMQIADGDVCRKLVIPIYMVFPRLFVCPTMLSRNFKVEFELYINVVRIVSLA